MFIVSTTEACTNENLTDIYSDFPRYNVYDNEILWELWSSWSQNSQMTKVSLNWQKLRQYALVVYAFVDRYAAARDGIL